MLNPHIFREYDIRGVADVDLTDDAAELIGKAYGTYIAGDQVVVGMDNRLSSERIKNALIKGLVSVGKNVIDIGLTITPILYYSRILYKVEGGIMITGSHNPKEYNGFKLCKGEFTMYGDQIKDLEEIIKKGEFKKEDEGTVISKNPIEDYEKILKEKIGINKKFKVVVDCGNGVSGIFAPQILKNWGCEVIPIFCKSDGNFPHHTPDPTKMESLKYLIEKVKETHADLGFGFDGDGDRIGLVDNTGKVIWGDMMQILFQRDILKKNPGEKVIIEVKCSQSLYDDVLKHGGKPIFWKTGHSLIKAKMLEEDILAAGEMSGHMFFRDEYYGIDDAMYAAGRILRILDKTGKSISELLSDASQYFVTPEIRAHCPDDRKFDIVAEMARDFKDERDVNKEIEQFSETTPNPSLVRMGIKEVIDVDGARVVFEDGWGLVRASNTQPALIVRAEGKTEDALERIKAIFEEKIKKFPEVEFEWE